MSPRHVIVRSPAAVAQERGRVHTAVVIDVLRATSTATSFMARGLSRLDVVATPEDLASLPPSPPLLVVTEIKRAREHHAWIDNSPVRAAQIALDDHRVVLVTTNGTRALATAAAHADRVLLASFLNVSAVAGHIAAGDPSHAVWIIPAGNIDRDEERTEDSECAEVLRALLVKEPPELPRRLQRVRDDARVQRRLQEEGAPFTADLALCLHADLHAIVLGFVSDDAQRGHVLRVG